MMNKRLTGAMGETLAATYYRKNGYNIIATNFRTRQGEIDIIASKKSITVFCEVKTRSYDSIANPGEFVTRSKQKRIILAAQAYISLNNTDIGAFRFDVVEVIVDKSGKSTLNCIENAFNI